MLYTNDADCCFLLQLREYCLRLRNMVASEATKAELSDAVDTMIEEVSWIIRNVKNFETSVYLGYVATKFGCPRVKARKFKLKKECHNLQINSIYQLFLVLMF